MDGLQIIQLLCITFATIRFYDYCKAKGKPWLTLVAAPVFGFVYIGLQFIFRYRIDLWGINLGEGALMYFLTALILSASVAALMAVAILIDKLLAKRVA